MFAPMSAVAKVEPEVLVIDDDVELRSVLAAYLSAHGYIVKTGSNGADALAELGQSNKFRLIILDLAMPVLSGYEFLQRREADPVLRKIPVIVLTAEPEQHPLIVSWCLRLAKPTSASTLLQCVVRWCGPPRQRLGARTGTMLCRGQDPVMRNATVVAASAPRGARAEGSELPTKR